MSDGALTFRRRAWMLVTRKGPVDLYDVPLYWSEVEAQKVRDAAGPRAAREDWRVVAAWISWEVQRAPRVQL